ncbi:MAG: hypothetical protein PVI43_02040, partial [Candidatus Bathyarchaeota archaeon]
KALEELEMFYGDRDCFASLHDWFGETETYWNTLKRLLIIADYTKEHNPSTAKKIAALSKIVVNLFQQTKNYASGWNSKESQISELSTQDYTKATDESWDNLDAWTVSQEKLRQKILDLIEVLYSSDSQL